MEIEILNAKGEAAGKVALSEKVFGLKPQDGFLHEAVQAHLANRRRGTASTKTRSEVSGGGRKPWKQKHTGRARQGSIRSPLWRKGGVVFGPKPRSYRQDLPKAKVLLALCQALSAKRADGTLKIVESFEVAEPKTKLVAGLLKSLGAGKGALVVLDQVSGPLRRASRNIQGLKLERASDLHAYEVLAARQLIITKGALAAVEARYN